MIRNFVAVLLISVGAVLHAQSLFKGYEHLFTPPERYVVFKTSSLLTMDGKADEPDWQNAKWSNSFVDIEGNLKPKPLLDTKVKMLWDEDNLYVYAQLEENNIWAYYLQRDMIVYHENDFEVFIDPDRDGINYFEFEVNAQNTLFDLFLTHPYRDSGSPIISWNADGMETAVSIDGTVNNATDKDKKWSVEMKIPFRCLGTNVKAPVPDDGAVWNINFSRVEWQTDVMDGRYVCKKDPVTGNKLPEYNWIWSPQGVINMHYPERWGNIRFSSLTSSADNDVSFRNKELDILVQYLWLVYYKQQDFKQKNNRYAPLLSDLHIPNSTDYIFDNQNKKANLKMEATDHSFYAEISNMDGVIMSITEKGWLNK